MLRLAMRPLLRLTIFSLLIGFLPSAPFLFSPTPNASAAPQEIATAQSSGSFPSTSVLDSFNRANGLLYWTTSFGANQEAYVTLPAISSSASEIDLLLKGQNASTCNLLEVWYQPIRGTAEVWTCDGTNSWQQQGSVTVTFAVGDQFGARALADGTVEVYRNGTLLGSVAVGSNWSYRASGGAIGVWLEGTTSTVLDNFGGGTVSTSATPTPTPAPTTTPTATNTPIPATNTPTRTPTNTPIPATNTPTNTPIPATNTPTNTPTTTNTPIPATNTPTLTNTPVPATNTPTATNAPAWTPTNTPTNTPVPATNTSTATNTPVLPTNTPTATALPTLSALAITISPASVFAGEPSVLVHVEAHDQYGNLVPSYRGTVVFDSTSAQCCLPTGGLIGGRYTFTAADAGAHDWTGVTLNTAGQQTISVYDDGGRSATSNAITVLAVSLSITTAPTTVFAGEARLTVRVEARDQNGALVPGYRGTVTFGSTSAQCCLPTGGLIGGRYTFTAADAGAHDWTGVTLNTPGQQTITVDDDGGRVATSNSISVLALHLAINVSPTTIFAGEPGLTVRVEARDQNGNLVPGYRGTVGFSSTSAQSGLPTISLGQLGYTFTAADAGAHDWPGVTLYTAGQQTIAVDDGTRQATSNAIQVNATFFQLTFSSPSSFVNDRTLTATLDVVDSAGQLVSGYRGEIDLNSSVAMLNLPQTTFQSTADYAFTAADAGRHVFSGLAFSAAGTQSLTAIDRGNNARQATASVNVTTPPDPTPPGSAGPQPPVYTVPSTIALPTPIPFGWGMPFSTHRPDIASNSWQAYPPSIIPASPGAFYIVSGAVQRGENQWWAGTFYACPYLGWENPWTTTRNSGGSVTNLPYQDPTFTGIGLSGCSGGSNLQNLGGVAYFGPQLSAPAPAGIKSAHINIEGGGNTAGPLFFTTGTIGDEFECDGLLEAPTVGDPIDTRSGEFSLNEYDFGVKTGCANVALRFERTYSTLHAASGSFSPGWVHNYEQRVIAAGDYVLVQRPRGSFLLFKDVGGDVYATRAGDGHTLVKRPGGGWALLYRDRRADLFDAQGRLIAQQDPNGNHTWMTYESYIRNGVSGSRLARVDAPGGRYLWFGYDYYRPNRIIVVGDTSGRVVRFSYDDAQTFDFVDRGRLVSVTDTLGGVTTYSYSESQWLLVAKTDARGNNVFTNTYNDDGRVIHQVNNTGENLALTYQIVNDTENLSELGGAEQSYLLKTTVTDQTGAQRVYEYGLDGLLRRETDPMGAQTRYRGYTDTRQPTEIIDPLGHSTQYTYSTQGLPTSITDPLGGVSTYTYDAWGNPTSSADPLNHTYAFRYTGPNMTELEDPSGQIVHYQYQTQAGWNGMLSSVDRQGALATTLTYNAGGDVTSSTDALGNVTQMTYDSLGRMIARTDARSNTTHYSYDTADRLIAITDPTNGTTHMQYDAVGNLTRIIDPRGATTIMTYDSGGRLLTRQDPTGAVTQFTYDTLGRLITVTDPLGHAQHTSYDLAGRPITTTDPLGQITRYGYDLLGNTTAITDANGHSTRTSYDALARPQAVTDATGQTTQYSYDAAGNVTVITDARGFAMHATYSALNRPLTRVDALGRTTTYTYNPLGLLATRNDGTGMLTRYTYDLLACITQISVNDQPGAPVANDVNLRTSYTYDAVGNLHTVTDPRGAVTTYSYNGRDQISSVLDALGTTTQYDYDAAGNLTGATNPRNATTSYAYDLAHRLTRVTDPNQHVRQFGYDAAGNLHTRTSAAGAVTTYSYDAANQLTAIDYPAGTADAGYSYDNVGNRLTTTDGLGTTSYTYDPLDRLATRTRDGRTLSYSYLPTGQISALDYWGHGTVQYGYNAAGQVASLTPWGAAPTSYTYRPNGQLAAQTRANGVATTYSYDGADRLISLLHTAGSTTLQPIAYMLDKNGNRIQVVDQDGTTTYQYDLLNRLSSAGYPAISGGPAAETISYTYDDAGNRLTQATTLPTAPLSWAYDLSDRISTPGYQYDVDGNLLNDGVTQYSYNAANQLIQTSKAGITTSYGYDGNGNLIRSTSAGVTTDYVLDEHTELARVVGEIRSDGSERRYAYGPEGVSAQQEQTGSTAAPVTYPLLDGQGTLRALTDASGALTLQQRFDAFGVLRQHSGSASSGLGYTGELTNPTDATVYLRARHYQPQLGRFLQQDTVGGFAPRPASRNRFTYAENNPATVTDPSGQFLGPLFFWMGVNDLGNAIQRFIRRNVLRSCGQLWQDTAWLGFTMLAVGMDVAALNDEVHAASAAAELGDEARLARSEGEASDDEARLARSEGEAEQTLGDCMNSFSADTPVAASNGERPIGEITIGDHVLAYNQDTGTTDAYTVTDVLIHTDPVIVHLIIANERIDTTPEHPFFVLLRGWVDSKDLHPGDQVRKLDGSYGTVKELTLDPTPQVMYNLTVAVAHTFFVGAGRWLVHNACPPIVRRFVSKAELKAARKNGIAYIPGDTGISATTTNLKPVDPDRIKWLTGAARADHYMDIRTTGKDVLEFNTKGGLPDYKIRADISPSDIVDYGRVRR